MSHANSSNVWLNTKQHFGRVSITLHWLMAILLIGLFVLGDYMVDLTYYDPWYNSSLAIHKAIGMLTTGLLVLRYLWVRLQPRPAYLNPEQTVQNFMATAGHALLYLLMLILMVSGYLITTAKGQGIDIFGLFKIPALISVNENWSEWLGDIHDITASAFMLLVIAHALASLMHHFILKDNTLLRMLRVEKS